MQKRRLIRVEFKPHVRSHLVESWRGGLAYCGLVTCGSGDRTFLVETHRDALFERLKDLLMNWERNGDASWVDITDDLGSVRPPTATND
jgi:hypothetical protein